MLKLFASLYLFVVISMVGLTALWEHILLPKHKEMQEPSLKALALTLSHISTEEIYAIAKQSGIQVSLFPERQIVFPEQVKSQFENDGYLILYNDNQQPEIYIPNDEGGLYQIAYANKPKEGPLWLYSAIFFVTLGLALAFWTWPLWRDIQTLESNVKTLNSDGTLPKLELSPRSSLHIIANALAQLSDKVHSLLQSQKELSGAVAHEFRTPLSRLKFALAMVDDNSEIDANGMQNDLNELENLVQEMLDYATLDSDGPSLSMAEISLHGLCEKLITKLEKSRQSPPIFMLFGGDITLMGDGYFIERAIQNVMVNAMKYATTQVQIHLQQDEQNVYVIVDDDGPGISPDDYEKIFDPFYRPDGSRSRDKGGAGLGLAIVARIQTWHGGQYWAESSPLNGARFVLSYPK
ncbi:ATP-binding protein [Alteromonas sp. a30]|uniref:ATP-binding protein n=1 Tax=Alteromonas sp. a30 TaxID=2730917 RepID=UPI002283060A|nr:ATP-binding protein [Alteromonas sp. a30]MCY7294709.1 two-component sensor histidine kinase [Alteromonas sp. a30]